MKLWERVVEARLREEVTFCKKQYGFMPKKSTTDALFALKMLMEKYREGQKGLHCVFVDVEKAYDRVPREELWYCMRKSGVSEKYVRVVQDMYEDSVTAVKCAVGKTDWFRVKIGFEAVAGEGLCDFEMDLCYWESSALSNHSVAWIWTSGVSASMFAPKVDHTTNSNLGHYMAFDTKPNNNEQIAYLQSELMQPVDHACLEVWYWMEMWNSIANSSPISSGTLSANDTCGGRC
ncbi:MAM and LDL-receptor class A domain-containing protein 1 [Silurus meridionalis]|nr:MAM and LDL-receptor class A domain-containing protein 1 [Silurus meridionalis]